MDDGWDEAMDAGTGAALINEGDIVAGKYRVERILGTGGMGFVVAAIHVALDQRVALKFLLPTAASRPDTAARFAREARAAAKLRSEHVAKVLDVGALPDGAPFIVMEYLEGEDLDHVFRRSGPQPIEATVGYILEACEAVAESHALGIVHRDLKPANLFLATSPHGASTVKVLDFGISKSTMGETASLTKTSAIMGSPLYMSPEQLTSAKSVDARSDIWALGVVLYQLLSGRMPFEADTMPELVALILQRPVDPLRAFRSDIPPGLESVIAHCLEKELPRRFTDIGELAEALVPFGPPRGAVSLERISHVLGRRPDALKAPSFAPARPGAVTQEPWTQSMSASVPRGVPRWVVAVLSMGILAAAGAFVALRPTASRVETATTAPPPPPAETPTPRLPPPSASAEPAPSAAVEPLPSSHPSASPPLRRTPPPVAPPAATKPPLAPVPSAKPTCQLVSYPDSEGNKHFKEVCQ